MTGGIISVFNRAPHKLSCVKDGRVYDFPGHELTYITEDVLMYARAQNPVMGSDDPTTLQFESLISRVETRRGYPQRHSLEPLSAADLQKLPLERINRSMLDLVAQTAQSFAAAFPRSAHIEGPSAGMVGETKFGGVD